MAIGDIGAAIATYTIKAITSMWPTLTQISGSLFAVCFRGPSGYGTCKSFLVDAAGGISEPASNELIFNSVATNDHYAVLRKPNVVADVYQIADASAKLEGIIVASDGTLSQHANYRCALVPNVIEQMNPFLRPDSIFACIYLHSDGTIYVGTASVAEDGEVGAAAIQTYQLTVVLSGQPSICDHVGDKHVCVFTDAAQHRWGESLNITDAGAISTTGMPAVDVCTTAVYRGHVMKLKDNWFVSVNRGGGNNGYAVLFKVLDDGTVSIPGNNVHTLETASCVWPRAIRLSDDVFAAVYTSASSYGKIKTVQVATTDPAVWTELDSHDFTGDEMNRCKIALRDPDVAVVASYDNSDVGHLHTISLDSEALALGHHELLAGIGP